jgi:hypothetical protein
MSDRTAFDSKYWNLAQAAAWVEYRERRLVEDFCAADRDAYIALGLYPSMWPSGRERRGSVTELHRALVEGQLTSWGYRLTDPVHLTAIPAAEWADLVISPPFAWVVGRSGGGGERWTDIRVRSADMKRLWRGPHEVSGRTKYDWAAVQAIFTEVKTQNPEMSQNELITEVQGAFEDRFNKGAPSTTSFKRKIKTWT